MNQGGRRSRAPTSICNACIMCRFFTSIYIIYEVEFVDKRYRINLMKGKHYNIIPHPLSHTKVACLFTHFLLPITQPT
jgi:hypothetical protein